MGLSGGHQRGLGGSLWVLMGVFYGFSGPKPTWDRMKRDWERPANTFVHFSVILGQKMHGNWLTCGKVGFWRLNLGAAGGPGVV